MSDEDISKILDIAPIELEEQIKEVPMEIETDIEFVRRNVFDLIKNGQDSVSRLTDLAHDSQHSEHYKALASLIKSTLDANKMLMELHRDRRDLASPQKGPTINNNILLTTNDILKLVKGTNQ